jgi:autoinducer 2-degrading protein
MVIVHVSISVKANSIEEFIKATVENARSSQKESGVIRFEFLQETEAPRQFLLVEIYQSNEDLNKHKNTTHYKIWREAVMRMMEEPRRSMKFNQLFPVS